MMTSVIVSLKDFVSPYSILPRIPSLVWDWLSLTVIPALFGAKLNFKVSVFGIKPLVAIIASKLLAASFFSLTGLVTARPGAYFVFASPSPRESFAANYTFGMPALLAVSIARITYLEFCATIFADSSKVIFFWGLTVFFVIGMSSAELIHLSNFVCASRIRTSNSFVRLVDYGVITKTKTPFELGGTSVEVASSKARKGFINYYRLGCIKTKTALLNKATSTRDIVAQMSYFCKLGHCSKLAPRS